MSDTEDNVEVDNTPKIDYDELDEQGFKKVEKSIFDALMKAIEKHNQEQEANEEPEPFDVEGWQAAHVESSGYDAARIKYVATFGVYKGERDEEMTRTGAGLSLYANGDRYEGTFQESKKQGRGLYIYHSLGSSLVDKHIMHLKETDHRVKEWCEYSEHIHAAEYILDHGLWKFELTKEQQKKGIVLVCPLIQSVVATLQYGPYPYYLGEFNDNKKDGQGIMKFKDGSIYEGQWKDDEMHGKGSMLFANGDIYRGSFANGKRHGEGSYIFAGKGCHIDGEWANGEMVTGKWFLADGVVYEGSISEQNDKFPEDSHGRFVFPDSQRPNEKHYRVEGSFVNGKWRPKSEFETIV